MRAAACALGLLLGLIALEPVRPPRPPVRRARETHRASPSLRPGAERVGARARTMRASQAP